MRMDAAMVARASNGHGSAEPAPLKRDRSRVKHRRAHAGIDGRSSDAVFLRTVRAELLAHIGREPSVPERLLVEQAAQIRLRIAKTDALYARQPEITQHAGREYLALANALAKILGQLGMRPGQPPPPKPKRGLGAVLAKFGTQEAAD
jgi:hypothetical protein